MSQSKEVIKKFKRPRDSLVFALLANHLELCAYVREKKIPCAYFCYDDYDLRFYDEQYGSIAFSLEDKQAIHTAFVAKYSDLLPASSTRNFHSWTLVCNTRLPQRWWGTTAKVFFRPLSTELRITHLKKEDGYVYALEPLPNKAQRFIDKYAAAKRSKTRTINIGIQSCTVATELPELKQDFQHVLSKTMLGEISRTMTDYITKACASFQKELAIQMINNLTMKICGVAMAPAEMKHLFSVSQIDLGRSAVSSRLGLLCQILLSERKVAEKNVHTLLTSVDHNDRHIGVIVARLLKEMPDDVTRMNSVEDDSES